MTINLTEDILSITELKQKTNAIIKQVNSTGRPVVLTVNGRAEAVLLGAQEYQKIQKAIELMKKILIAEQNVALGKVKEASSFFKELRSAKKI